MAGDKKKPIVMSANDSVDKTLKDLIGNWEGNPGLRRTFFEERKNDSRENDG